MRHVSLFATVVTLMVVPRARGVSFDALIPEMETAAQSIDSFQCDLVLTRQSHGTGTIQCAGGRSHLAILDPSQWPPPRSVSYNWTVSGERYREHKTAVNTDGSPFDSVLTWDGMLCRHHPTRPNRGGLDNEPLVTPGTLFDPRTFAYRPSPVDSLLDELRALHQAGSLTVQETTFENRGVLLIDAVASDTARKLGYKVWVDPARGFLPVQIETYGGPHLAYRYHEIEHVQLPGGRWFPVKGRLDHLLFRCDEHRGQTTDSTYMEVNVSSINLSPPIGPGTFALTFPPGTEVHDFTSEDNSVKIYVAAVGPTLDESAQAAVDEAIQMTTTQPAGAQVSAGSRDDTPIDAATGRGNAIGRLAAWGVGLAALGFATSWVVSLSRSRFRTH